MNELIYLDWNATTPRHPSVKAAMEAAEPFAWANPSSIHRAGRRARRIQEETRELLAHLLCVQARDVVFTGGGTEANHLALHGARHLVTSRIEHPSVVAQAEAIEAAGGRVWWCPVTPEGVVTADAVEAGLEALLGQPQPHGDPAAGGLSNRRIPLVAVMAANHETGVIQPTEAIAEVAHRWGARLHVDAVQVIGRHDLEPLQHADSVAMAGHKLRGPKGVGALAFACGWNPLPVGRGGAQERGLRPGTVDAVALAGLGAALSRLEESRHNYAKLGPLRDLLEAQLVARLGTGVSFHGSPAQRLPHVSNFRIAGWKGDELVAALDLEGVCVSSGSACSAGTAEPSGVIVAMHGREAAAGAVRVSLGETTTESEIRGLLDACERLGVWRAA